jgi:hypothetical protein
MKSSSRLVMIVAAMLIILIAGFFLISQRFSVDPSRTHDLELRVQRLEESQNSISMFGGREHIISPDRLATREHLDLRLPAGTNGTNRFQLRSHYKIPDEGRPVAAWVSEWTPRAEILEFEEFHIVSHTDTGEIELVAKPRSGETIDMTFDVRVLIRDFSKIQTQ